MIDQSNFMVFSIDDEQIQCVELFKQSLMFVSTERSIMLYDLCSSTIITSCGHQTRECKQLQNDNNNNENQLEQQQNQITQQAAIEIHYFPIPVIESSLKSHNNLLFSSQQQQPITIGHLLVHYKMKGISIYNLNKISKNNSLQLLVDQDTTLNNTKFQIAFNNHTPVMFASAFLKFAFNNVLYKRFKTSFVQQQSFKQTILSSTNSNNQHLETVLMNIEDFEDYKLVNSSQRKQSRQFYIFTNQNQLYEVKMMKLSQSDGKLLIMERYQLDEESAELSLGTVTAMVVVAYEIQQPRQLIVAMQGGNVFTYQLPIMDKTSSNTQHYLQPTKTLHLQQELKFLKNSPPTQKNQEQFDYSIISIEMMHNRLGLVVVRKMGVWVVDFRQLKVVGKVQGLKIKSIIDKRFDVEEYNQKDKRTYQFNDSRMVKLIISQISTKIDPTSTKKQAIITSILILCTQNKLYKLTFSISISKQFDTNKIYQQSIQINKGKFTTLQEINTNLIEDMKIVKSKELDEKQGNRISNDRNRTIQLYGHFKEDKVFHLFLC